MIPNSLSSTGPYAGLWSHLKSIDHALNRVHNGEYSELDRERLKALAGILEGAVPEKSDHSRNASDLLLVVNDEEPDYTSALNVRESLPEVPEFADWLRKQKLGVDAKLQKLISALQGVADKKELFSRDFPQEEFAVLRGILQTLLRDAETALEP